MSRTSFGVNLHLLVFLNVKEIVVRSRRHYLIRAHDRAHDHLVSKRTLNHLAKPAKWLICVVSIYLCFEYLFELTTQLNHLASLAKWLSVHLQAKWLWVWIQLQSHKSHRLSDSCKWACITRKFANLIPFI